MEWSALGDLTGGSSLPAIPTPGPPRRTPLEPPFMLPCGVRVLRGPNRWTTSPVFEAHTDLRPLERLDAGGRDRLRARLLEALPPPGPYDPARGDVERRLDGLRVGDVPPHRLPEVLARILLGLTGSSATLAETHPTGEPGHYRVVLGFEDEAVDRACLDLAWRLLAAFVGGEPIDEAAEVAALKARANRDRLGPSTQAITRAAEARGIPVSRLNDGSLVQLGWGARQRRVWTAISDRTGWIGAEVASDKELTRRLLRRAGLPAPAGRIVSSAEDAWAAAREVGTPVVVKPRDANHAQGVSVRLTTREQVERAFAIAAGIRGDSPCEVIVERYVAGDEYRLLVVGRRLVAASRGEPAQVVGDGERSVLELVEELNRDPRRGSEWRYPLDRVELDDVARLVLADQGFSPGSVPPRGARVVLQRTADRSIDVTDLVHPEVASRAVEAAATVGLDIAGIDLLAADIGRPLEDQGGAIVEVNAGPGLMAHLRPTSGRPRPVGEAIVAGLFAEGDDGRIPVVALTGGRRAAARARALARRLQGRGRAVGLACSSGASFRGRRLALDGSTPATWARGLLANPLVDVLVVEVRPDDVREEGLPFDRCDRAYVLDWDGAPPTDEQAEAARLVASSVRAGGTAVLHVAGPFADELASCCAGRVVRLAPRAAGNP